jgi:hypothetical protein
MDTIHLLDIRNAWFVWFGYYLGDQRTNLANGQIGYTYMVRWVNVKKYKF